MAEASEVQVEPASPDDWELLELHAAFLEEQLLAQARQSARLLILGFGVLGFGIRVYSPKQGVYAFGTPLLSLTASCTSGVSGNKSPTVWRARLPLKTCCHTDVIQDFFLGKYRGPDLSIQNSE